MVSKSALEQAERLSAQRMGEYEQKQKAQNAEVRRGLFLLLLALVWGIIKIIFHIVKSIVESSNKYNSLD